MSYINHDKQYIYIEKGSAYLKTSITFSTATLIQSAKILTPNRPNFVVEPVNQQQETALDASPLLQWSYEPASHFR